MLNFSKNKFAVSSVKDKANLASLIIMILASIFMITNSFLSGGLKYGINTTVFTLPCVLFVYFLIKMTGKNSDICAYTIPLLILGASIFYIINNNGCPQAVTLLSMSCLMASLYYNTKVILTVNICFHIINCITTYFTTWYFR